MDKICGKWRVKMDGWRWFWFWNVKVIWQNIDGSIQGHNVLWGFIKWGDFDVEILTLSSANFNYIHFSDHVQYQRKFTDKYGDQVIAVDDSNAMVGLLYRKGKCRAHFTMTRILPETKEASQ